MKTSMKKYIISGLLAVFFAGILIFSANVREAAYEAVLSCLETLVPSLFAFSAGAIYLQKSGLYRTVLAPFTAVLSRILRLDRELCGIFLLANIGGYPVGASLLAEPVRDGRLTRRDAERLLGCCFASGPSFAVSVVGAGVFGDTRVGAALFAAGFLANFTLLALVRARGNFELKIAGGRTDLSAECFTNSITAGARAMLTVCAAVVFFACFSEIFRSMGINSLFERVFAPLGENAGLVFPALLDVTRVSKLVPDGRGTVTAAVFMGLGGVCVLAQIMSIFGKFSVKKFILMRIFSAIFGAIFTVIFLNFIPEKIEPVILVKPQFQAASGNVVMSAATLAMCVILCMENRRKNT